MNDSASVSLSSGHRAYLTGHAVSNELIDTLIAEGKLRSEGGSIVFVWDDGEHHTEQRRPWPGESGQYYWEKDVPLHLNVIREPSLDAPVLLAEGTKQSLAVASWAPAEYAVYGMPGCYGWIRDRLFNVRWAQGRRVLILLDADAAENLNVYEAGERLAIELDMEGATAVFVPSPAWGKDGIDDYLARTAEDQRTDRIVKLIGKAKTKPAGKRPTRRIGRADLPDTGGRALVVVNQDRLEVIETICSALYGAFWQELYDFGGALTKVRGAIAEPLEKGPFLAQLVKAVACFKYREATQTSPARYDPDCWPDPQTVEAVLSSADRFLPLRRISRTPFARPDGTACTVSGYDSATQTLLVTDLDMTALPVPDNPSSADVNAATRFLLDEWLGDMPFENEVSRANALGLILTPFIRGQVPIVPWAAISGLQPGVGKGLLGDCLSILVTGEPTAPLPYVPDDEAETRKQLTAAFREGADLFIFDEAHVIQGSQLARAVTSLTYQDRVLGVSKMIQFPNQVTWMSLGNNVVANADMARRVYQIRLIPDCFDPEDRDESQFSHPELRAWTKEHRAQLVQAVLILIRAWHANGQPRYSRGSLLGSFEAWDKMISGILGNAGVSGFLADLAERRAETDYSGGYWAGHVAWLADRFGTVSFTTLEVKTKAQAASGTWDAPPDLDDPMDRGWARKLGQAYARNQGRWFKIPGGRGRLQKVGTGHGTIVKWTVESMEEGPPSPNGFHPSPNGFHPPFHPPADPSSNNGSGNHQTPPSPPDNSQNGASGYSHDVFPVQVDTAGNGSDVFPVQVDTAVPVSNIDPPVRDGTDGTDGTAIGARKLFVVPDQDQMDGTDGTDGTYIPSRARETFSYQDHQEKGVISIGGGVGIPPFHPVPSQPVSSQLSVGFDLETADAGSLFTYTSNGIIAGQVDTAVPAGNPIIAGQVDTALTEPGFVRLAGVIGPSGTPILVTQSDLMTVLDQATEIYGHNILGFDGLALAWHYGLDWEKFAAKARDTELIARQADPPRSRESLSSEDQYDLDHVAERLGLPGKTDDLKRLKQKFGGYDKIPVDDPEYRSYLEGDLRATQAVSMAMAARYPYDSYIAREHQLAGIAGRMTLNGFRVDQSLLEQRIEEGAARKRAALAELADVYKLPLSKTITKGRGKNKYEEQEELVSPLASTLGKKWLEQIWAAFGIDDPPRTKKTGGLATGADELAVVAARPGCDPRLRRIIELMAIVTTTRTVYQTAADCLAPDGRVHPGISFRQASGRWSVTNPGLTVFGKRGGRHHERDVFLPDEGHVLFSCDLSQVDMRAMAGHCQDSAYMALFAPGRDVHSEIAEQVFGTRDRRQDAKAVGHGWNYGLGANRMIKNGMNPEMVYGFVNGMETRFPRLIEWRQEIRQWAEAGNILDNGFGRRMLAEPNRAYTVAPALMGQGTARDIFCESLLRLPRELDPYLRVYVHDEVVLSVPADEAERVGQQVREAMTWNWRGVPIECDMNGPGASWGEISGK